MGLLKGSKLNFTQAETVISVDGVYVVGGEPEPEPGLEAVVPEASQADDMADLVAGLEDEWSDGGLEQIVEQAEPEPGPFEEYDEVRSHLIASAEQAAQLDAEAFHEQVQTNTGVLMEANLDITRQALEEANPEGHFEAVMPYVQRRVAAELDLELVGTVSEIRWTHLQRIEEKITAEAETVASELEERHPPETFAELLAQREEILSAARLEAERLMMEAQTQAAALMAEAERAQEQTLLELEAERERILSELRAQAHQEGYEEGKRAGEEQAAVYIDEALNKLNEIAVAFPQAVKQNEEKLITLALEIASKVIQEEISLQPEIVQRTVETALKRVSDLEQVVVKVNPLDLDLILPKQDTFKSLVPDVQNFSIEGSHTIARGGCMIETNSGSINATINAQLSIIEELFKKVRADYEDDVIGELE